jgi:hypothetical protein
MGVTFELLVGAVIVIGCYFWVRPAKTVRTSSNA